MERFTFFNPTRLLFGPGVVGEAGREAARIGRRALLVTGKASAERSGLRARVQRLLEKEGVAVLRLAGVDPNPRIASVREGIRLCRENELDLVVGLGGGSAMDCAKVIAAGVLYPGDPWDIIRHGQRPYVPPERSLPTLMVPTLAATGSEMNCNAVITNPEEGVKSFVSRVPCLFPRVAVADPELTCSVPAAPTACGAVDIIAHALEPYINGVGDTPLQDRLLEGVIQTVMDYAPRAVDRPDDLEARTHLQLASIHAMNGWLSAGIGAVLAVHHIEHVLSAITDVAHGAGLAILLPAWMKVRHRHHLEKYVRLAARLFNAPTDGRDPEAVARDGINRLEDFFRDIGVPTRLSEIGVSRDSFDLIAGEAIRVTGDESGRLPCTPPVDHQGIVEVLEAAL